jgi:anti-sigma factor RsiW
VTIDGRRFSVTLPDWGQDHLSPEAVVAYVDDELADGPYSRATRHIDTCSECAVQVVAQAQARAALRSAEGPTMSPSFLNSLRSIPQDADLPEAPAGLAITDEGEFVAFLRSEPAAPARPATSRRMRFGAGAAMSGLALGAIALGGSAVAGDAPDPTTAAPRGVFDGSVLGGGAADAQLRIAPAAGASADVPSQTRRIPGSFLRRP